MGFFGKLFGGDKTQVSGMDHSMIHSGSSGTPSTAKNPGMEHTMEHTHSTSTSTMAKDPVCGMDVDVNKAAAKSEYQGQTYYFCAPGCKTEFDKNPAKYASGQTSGGHSHGQGCCC